jgi:hypothetical protein
VSPMHVVAECLRAQAGSRIKPSMQPADSLHVRITNFLPALGATVSPFGFNCSAEYSKAGASGGCVGFKWCRCTGYVHRDILQQ